MIRLVALLALLAACVACACEAPETHNGAPMVGCTSYCCSYESSNCHYILCQPVDGCGWEEESWYCW